MNRKEWLEARRSGIGGSDAPNILGIGYRSPESVYRSKIDPVKEGPPSGILRRGLDLEDIVAAMYREVMDDEIIVPEQKIVRHPDRPWQLVSQDRVRTDDNPVELKTTLGFGDEFGPNGSDQVPEDYRVQCLHTMAVTEAKFCDLVALDLITWEPRVYRIMMNQEQADMLTSIEERFWKLIQEGKPLPEDWSEQVSPTVQRIVVKGKAIELPPEVLALIEKRKAFDKIEKEAEIEKKAVTAAIDQLLGDAEIGLVGDWKVKRVTVSPHEVKAHFKKGSSYIRVDPIKQKRIT